MSVSDATVIRPRSLRSAASGWEAPAAAVALLVIGLCLAVDVSAWDIVRFCAYEAGFLLLPGWLAYIALSGRRHGALREISIGWALGHVLEIAAFFVTASLGAREWLLAYPVVVIGGSLAATRLQRIPLRTTDRADPEIHEVLPRLAWTTAGVFAVVLLYTALVGFAQLPLPGPAGFKGWFPDAVFSLDISAEALHHWPILSPEVSGVSFPYQIFVYMHTASIAQVTGIGLPVVVLRLSVIAALIMTILAMSWAGKALTGEAFSGPIAAGLVLLVGEINPRPAEIASKFQFLFGALYSPTALLGLTLFVPAVVLVAERIGAVPRPEHDRRGWLVLALLLIGCSGSKGPILPVMIGGLLLYVGAIAVRTRRLDRRAVTALGLSVAVFIASYPILYGGNNEGLAFNLKGAASESSNIGRVGRFFDHIAGVSSAFYIAANVLLVLIIGAAPLAGLIWLARDHGRRLSPATLLLLGLSIAGLGTTFFFTAPGSSNEWFTYYGFAAATLLSAYGLCQFWRAWRPRHVARLLMVGLAWAAAICVISYLAFASGLDNPWEALVWAGTVAAVATAVRLVWRSAADPRRLGLAAMVMLPVLVFGALDVPVHIAPETVETGAEPLYANGWGYVPGGLVAGLDWARAHSATTAVLAANNYQLQGPTPDPTLTSWPAYMYYSALSQRRVFLEGWFETAAVLGKSDANPFPDRRKLNDAVFQRADPRALSILRAQYGVRYLIVDMVNGTAGPALGTIARLAYENRDVKIYSASP